MDDLGLSGHLLNLFLHCIDSAIHDMGHSGKSHLTHNDTQHKSNDESHVSWYSKE